MRSALIRATPVAVVGASLVLHPRFVAPAEVSRELRPFITAWVAHPFGRPAAYRSGAAASVADTARTPVLGGVRGAFMALSVSDVSTSRRWYVETLGLRATMEIPYANGAAVTVLEGGGLIVELVQLDSAVARTRSAERIHGFFKAGIVVDDLDGVLAELRRRGAQVAFGPFPARDGQRANVIIRDNAGNLIQLFGRS